MVLADGDIVKVQLGVHIDGFCAMAAHTAVVGAADARPVVGPSADVLAAAYAAAQIAVRLVKPGNKNSQVTEAIRRVAEAYGVTPLAGVLSHELKQFVVDGNKVILLREDHDTKVEEVRVSLGQGGRLLDGPVSQCWPCVVALLVHGAFALRSACAVHL